jgi:photosystem II stability/assembly factor-like uncharacterized protein
MSRWKTALECIWLFIGAFFVASPLLFTMVAQERPIVAQKRFEGSLPVMHSEGVGGMKQLSPGVGWTMMRGRLLWTNDNGAVWTDITPEGPASRAIYDLFFLDTAHAWIAVGDASVGAVPQYSVRLVRTEDGGRSWNSTDFDMSSYASLRNTIAKPASVWFVDYQHGWFLWKIQTSSAFSEGKLFSTDDGGATWSELPDPPSANGLRFHTQLDGWMTGGATADEIWGTHDGGRTWQQKSVPPAAGCGKCRPVYSIPRFQDPKKAVLTATFVDDDVVLGRSVHSTYVTYDGGDSWQDSESYEQTGPYSRTAVVSSFEMHAIRVFSNAKYGIQIQTGGVTANSIYPKEVPPRGSIAATDFADDLNGWLVYQAPQCYKYRNRAADGPGLPCKEGVLRNDLLATTDGGRTFKVITPSGSSQ